MAKRYGCCGVPWRIATVLLLSSNNILNCFAVIFLILNQDCLLKNRFFSDEVEMFMTQIFVLIEVIVFFCAIKSVFKKKTSMLVFAIVMSLLESFFIILAAARMHYFGILKKFWLNVLKPEIAHLTNESLKEIFKSDEESVPVTLMIIFCLIVSLILLMKIYSAVAVNSYKNHTEAIRIENAYYQMKNGREYIRPTSYIYATITAEDKQKQMSRFE